MKLSIVHKISLLSVMLVFVTTIVLSLVFYSNAASSLVKHALQDITEKITDQGYKLQSQLKTQKKDVLLLSKLPATRMLLSLNAGNSKSAKAYTAARFEKHIVSVFKSMMTTEPEYLKLRLIDTRGNEIVTVVRSGNELQVLPKGGLQNKSRYPYVSRTLELASGKTYVSAINLNREQGKVSRPLTEVLRTATPVFDAAGKSVLGLVVINYEIGHELREIQKEIRAGDREIFITNSDGGYLLHPDSERTYGFDLGKRYRVQEDLPQLARFFLPGNKDRELTLLPETTGTDKVTVYAKVLLDKDAPEHFIAVGISQPYSSVFLEQHQVLGQALGLMTLLMVAGILLALWIAVRISRPIKQMTRAVNDYTEHRESDTELPVNQKDEVGMLARGFREMINQVDVAEMSMRQLNENLEVMVYERTAKLEASEAVQRAIVDNIVDGIVIIDEHGLIDTVNPAVEKIFGYEPGEVTGHNVRMLMPEPYASEHDRYLANYLETGQVGVIGRGREVEGQRKNGEVFPLDLAVSEMHLAGKRMFVGVVRDITERKYVDKMKSEFISTVSHELRTPLTSIRGSLGLLTGGAVGELNPTAAGMLDIASSNTERLLMLINDILDLQKIESGQMEFHFKRVNIGQLLQQAMVDNDAYAQQYGTSFRLSDSLPDVDVYADPSRLAQVLANLMSNAAKFSDGCDHVDIGVTHVDDGRVRVSITDYGSGIPESFREKIFERFTQSDSSDARQKGGTGLGLNITKVIVEKLGGHIDFVSKTGEGTTFWFDLPEMQAVRETGNKDVAPGGTHKQADILVIEDDVDAATIIQKMLEHAGYGCEVAYDIETARQLLAADDRHFKAVTLDLALPGEDGIAFLEELRTSDKSFELPIVVISGIADISRNKLDAVAVDVVDWLQKPFRQNQLLSAIQNAIGRGKVSRILHVEDEEDVCSIVRMLVKDEMPGVTLSCAGTLEEARRALQHQQFELVLLDIGLPDGSGLDLLRQIGEQDHAAVIIFSANDVPQEYAEKVSAVLLKARTQNIELANEIRRIISSTDS